MAAADTGGVNLGTQEGAYDDRVPDLQKSHFFGLKKDGVPDPQRNNKPDGIWIHTERSCECVPFLAISFSIRSRYMHHAWKNNNELF